VRKKSQSRKFAACFANFQSKNPYPQLRLSKSLLIAEPEGYLRIYADMGQPMASLLYQTLARDELPNYVSKYLFRHNKVQINGYCKSYKHQ
jgi:hypothetical protein